MIDQRIGHSFCLWVASLLLLSGCSQRDDAGSPPVTYHAEIVRTADPSKRGFSDTDFPRVQELAPGVYSYEQLRALGEERFTTVSLFVVTDEGILVADGQGSVEETALMVSEIRKVSSRPITHVVICSDHGDHTAGNRAFPETAVFLAHPNSMRALERQAQRQAEAGSEVSVVLPDELVEERRTLELGGRRIEILFLGRAHTGGDLNVYLPDDKILFMSEAYLNRIFPAMRSAYPTEWVEMIRRAQELDVETYVPGHGFVESAVVLREELDTFRRGLERVTSEARRLYALGLTPEQAEAQANFGDLESWTLRSSQARRAIARVYDEIKGELPD